MAEIRAGETSRQQVTLRRWVDMSHEGWYSSDMHVHFGHDSVAILQQLVLADDLNLLPVFTYWYSRLEKMRPAWPHWPQGAVITVDATHLITLDNIEVERIGGEPFHSLGAPFFFNMTLPLYVENGSYAYPCNTMLQRAAKSASPSCVIDTDKPLWGENVVGVALGLFDVVQICHNHYHRRQNLKIGWGMIGALEENELDLARRKDELLLRSTEIYYRWLNCGFRLGVSGGSAMGVMPVPLGYNRTYAHLEDDLTPAKYWQAVRAGRTFATSGPMLTMTVNDSAIGSTLQFAKTMQVELTVAATVRSAEKLSALEIIANGVVVKREDLSALLPDPSFAKKTVAVIAPDQSGWVAARVLYHSAQGHLRLAHTSPVYFVVDGQPIVSEQAAEYMLRWLGVLDQITLSPDRYQSDTQRASVQAIFLQAKGIYEAIRKRAVERNRGR
jgi:hypothetical protein